MNSTGFLVNLIIGRQLVFINIEDGHATESMTHGACCNIELIETCKPCFDSEL